MGVLYGGAPVILKTAVDIIHRIEFPDNLSSRSREVVLKANKETNLYYSLAPRQDAFSAIEQPISSKLNDLLEKGDTVLSIKFQCNICRTADNFQMKQSVQYLEESNSSEPIEFRFTPLEISDVKLSQEYPSSEPAVSLIVLRDGILYDRIDIPVKVESKKRSSDSSVMRHISDSPEFKSKEIFDLSNYEREISYSERINKGGQPDISMELVSVNGSPLQLHVEIHDDTLQTDYDPIFVSSTEPRTINKSSLEYSYLTRFQNFEEVKTLARKVYLRLSCLTVAPETDESIKLRKAAKSILKKYCYRYVGNISEHWTIEQLKNIGGNLASIGYSIFYKMAGDKAFRESFDRLIELGKKRADNDPIKILFKSKEHLPIQLLYPFGTFTPEDPKFFGLIFDLAERQYKHPPLLGELSIFPGKKWETVFGGFKGDYRKTNEIDLISIFSKTHYNEIRDKVMSGGGLTFENQVTSQNFLNNIIEKRKSVDLIWTYVHGDGRGWSAPYYPKLDSTPKLIFGLHTEEIDYLPVEYILEEMSRVTQENNPLAAAPLVTLIACESGSGGLGGTSGNKFSQEFFQLGARGVITTEAEIHAGSASLFGAELIDSLVNKKTPPSRAVLTARRNLFKTYKNLWSLLFHYEGAHGFYAGP